MCLFDANFTFFWLLFLSSGQPIVDRVSDRLDWRHYDFFSGVLDIYLKVFFHSSNKFSIEVYIFRSTLSSNLIKDHLDCSIIVMISSFWSFFSGNEVHNVWWSVVDTTGDGTNRFCDIVILENIKQVSLDDFGGLIHWFNSS